MGINFFFSNQVCDAGDVLEQNHMVCELGLILKKEAKQNKTKNFFGWEGFHSKGKKMDISFGFNLRYQNLFLFILSTQQS